MAWLSMAKIGWGYVAGNGTTYRRAAQTTLTTQLDGGNPKIGGAAANSSMPKFRDADLRPRAVYCTLAANPTKLVVAYTATAYILTAGGTINLNTGVDSAAYTTSTDWIPERKLRAWGIKHYT